MNGMLRFSSALASLNPGQTWNGLKGKLSDCQRGESGAGYLYCNIWLSHFVRAGVRLHIKCPHGGQWRTWGLGGPHLSTKTEKEWDAVTSRQQIKKKDQRHEKHCKTQWTIYFNICLLLFSIFSIYHISGGTFRETLVYECLTREI